MGLTAQLLEATAYVPALKQADALLAAARPRFGLSSVLGRVEELLPLLGPVPIDAAEHAALVRSHVPTVWASFTAAVRATLMVRYLMNIAIYIFIHLSRYPSIYLSICAHGLGFLHGGDAGHAHGTPYLYIYIYIYIYVCIYIDPPLGIVTVWGHTLSHFMYLSIYIYIHLSTSPSIYLNIWIDR